MELAINGAAVGHIVDLEIAGVSGMDLVDDSRDGFSVGAAHDVVSGAANDEYRLVHLLPDFAEVQGLQLLIKRCGTAVLTVRGLIPETFPFGMLSDDLAGRHSFHQVENVELDKRFDCGVDFGWWFGFFRQASTFQVEHVFVPGATPGTGCNVSADEMLAGNQRRCSAAIAQAYDEDLCRIDKVILEHFVKS